MRSHTGCLTCRTRKVKCDEAKPTCGPCGKASRGCIFSDSSNFRSFEHRTPPRRRARRKKSLLKRYSRESSLFDECDVWVAIPEDLTFIRVENPYEHDSTEPLDDSSGSHQDQDGDHLCQPDGRVAAVPDLIEDPTPQVYHSLDIPGPPVDHSPPSLEGSSGTGEWASVSAWNDADAYDSHDRHATPRLQSYCPPTAESLEDAYDSTEDSDPESHITAIHLIRYFKEGPGQWLDLFDTSAYFTSIVPVMASKSQLLKFSICAVSSKHLHRTGTDKPFHDKQSLSPTHSNHKNWKFLSAKYYHRAIGFLKQAVHSLGVDEGLVRSSLPPEEIFAAVAVLCIYELMDAPGTAWRAHLSAIPLFVPSSDSAAADCLTTVTIPRTAIKGPIFWCLARQDFLCACIGETQTRLKLEDMRLWHRIGLATDENRFQLPFSPSSFADNSASAEAEEDIKSNELVRILSRIVNHITSGDAVNPKDYARPPGQRPELGVTQERLLQRWNTIMDELAQWYAGLPATFQPSARTRLPRSDRTSAVLSPSLPHSASPSSSSTATTTFEAFEQIWYDVPQCAGTMVSYHLAMILLLANRPQESTAIRSTVSARLRNYRADQQGVLHHSREICGINLADVPASVRIHSVQPIFVAGQVFHRVEDQEAVLQLLWSIERDLGWSTSYYICKLRDEWGV